MRENLAVRHIVGTVVCGIWENVPEETMFWMRPECLEWSGQGKSRKCPIQGKDWSSERGPSSAVAVNGGRVRWPSWPGLGNADGGTDVFVEAQISDSSRGLTNSQQLPTCFDYEVINHFIAFSFGGPLRKNGSLFPSTPQLFFFSLLLYARLKPSAHLQLCLLSPYFLLPIISRTVFTCFHLESIGRQSRSVQTSA